MNILLFKVTVRRSAASSIPYASWDCLLLVMLSVAWMTPILNTTAKTTLLHVLV